MFITRWRASGPTSFFRISCNGGLKYRGTWILSPLLPSTHELTICRFNPLNFVTFYLLSHVTTSQSQRSQHHCRQAQRSKTVRTRRFAQKTRTMEGNEQGDWAA